MTGARLGRGSASGAVGGGLRSAVMVSLRLDRDRIGGRDAAFQVGTMLVANGGDDADTDGDDRARAPVRRSTTPGGHHTRCAEHDARSSTASAAPAIAPSTAAITGSTSSAATTGLRGTPLAPSTPSSRVRCATVRVVATATSTTPTSSTVTAISTTARPISSAWPSDADWARMPVGHPEHDDHEERAGRGGDDGQHHLADPPARGQPPVGQACTCIISGPPADRPDGAAAVGARARARRRSPSRVGSRRPCLRPAATRSGWRCPESPAPQRFPRRATPTR